MATSLELLSPDQLVTTDNDLVLPEAWQELIKPVCDTVYAEAIRLEMIQGHIFNLQNPESSWQEKRIDRSNLRHLGANCLLAFFSE